MKPRRILSAARLSLPFASALAALLVVSSASAQLYWDSNGTGTAGAGGTPTGTWGSSAFWNTSSTGSGGALSTATANTDNLFYVAGPSSSSGNGNTTITISGGQVANSLTFQHSGNFTLSGGTSITLGDGTADSGGINLGQFAFGSTAQGAVAISTALSLNNSQTWTNNASAGLTVGTTTTFLTLGSNQLTIGGTGVTTFGIGNNTVNTSLSGSGALVKNGTGVLQIGGTNASTYSGKITINNGILMYGDTVNSLGTGNIEIAGGILESRWTTSFSRAQGTTAGQIQITGGESGFAINGATTGTFNIGAITWGSATFNPTKLVLQSSRSQSGSGLTLSSAIDLNGANRTIFANAGSVGNATSTISGAITNGTGTAGLIKEGSGLLALSTTNTYNGGTTISAGTLRFDTRLSMPASGTVTVADGAILGVTVAGSGTTWGSGTGVAGIAGLTSTANTGGEGYGGQAGTIVNFNGNSGLLLNVTGNVSEANDITNGTATSIRLIKAGASNLTLSGNNSYSGGTTLSAGALIVASNTAIPTTGTLALNGGTIQSNGATARSFSNAVTIGGDITVGATSTGNLTFSNTGASALGATRQITVATGVNATFAQAFSGSGAGITKAGAGTLTLTGNNTFTGATTINAGAIVLNNGGNVTGSAVTFGANNTSLTVTGGATTSIWNAGGGNFATGSNTFSNVQILIDGAGTAGSARVTNVGTLVWGRTAINSTITLTNGGQMNVNGEIRIGNPYYSETGGANLTIGGGTATSTFTGNNPTTSNDFYIGYGERTGSKNNVVTVSSGGVLTGIRDMVVGHVFDAQNNSNPSTNNQLLVTGGTASMRGISLGFANATSNRAANANIVSVTGGGTLTSTGAVLIGRANLAGSESNSNTMTVSGSGSTWNASSQNVTIGSTNNATAISNNNILTVGAGAVVSNIATLAIGSGAGTETGNKLVLNGGSVTATTVTVQASNSLEIGTNGGSLIGSITNNGTFTIGSNVAVSLAGNISGTTGTITQTGSGTTTLSGTNSYTGTTAVNAGTLHFAKMVSLNNNVDTNWTAAKINVKSAATFALNVDSAGTNGFTDTKINTLLTNISVANTAAEGLQAGAILGLDTSTATGGTFTQGNAIADSTGANGGAIGVTKLGTGTLVFDKTNTYTGATTVSAGTLRVNGSHTGGGTYTVASTGTLQGTGSTTSVLNVSGTLSPGASIETFGSGTLNMLTGSTFEYEVDSLGLGADLQKVTGDFNLTGLANLTIGDLAVIDTAFTLGTIFSLINYTGSWNNGEFTVDGNAIADEGTFTVGLNTWKLDYNSSTGGSNFIGEYTAGSFVNITAVVPEPSTALLTALGVLALLRRRR